jgi:prolyl oligopeptidase
MEDRRDPEYEPWMRAQAGFARRALDRIPGLASMQARVSALSGSVPFVIMLQRAGQRIFLEKRPAGVDQFQLFVREADGSERVLVDPTRLRSGEAHMSLDWWRASPTGDHVVYGLSPAGSENSVLHVMEVATGQTLAERIDGAQYADPCWLPDGSGFFFNRLAEGARAGTDAYYKNSACWLHRLGAPPGEDQRILARGQFEDVSIEEIDFPTVSTSPGSAYALALLYSGVQREVTAFTARLASVLAGKPTWRRVCAKEDQVTHAKLIGGDLYLLTFKEAPRYKVTRVSAEAPAIAHAQTVVPQSTRVAASIVAAQDGLYVVDLDGGVGRLRRVDRRGGVREVILPFEGALSAIYASADRPGADIILESWVRPPTLYRCDPRTLSLSDTGLQPQPDLDLAPYESKRVLARARDGVEIPLSILFRRDIALDGSNPALVSVYGAYGVTVDPFFLPRNLAFLDSGGVLAVAHARGGGEFGRAWHEAGRLGNKPNTWRDLIDCCEALVGLGYTRPEKLAIQGGSAGAIGAGRALTERPDLFAAAILSVGLTNTLRMEFSQNGPPNIPEFGSVRTEDGFRALREMDSYQHVSDGAAYPAVLLTAGMTDPRVETWHAAKLAARLQTATSSRRPVLLRVEFDGGHGYGATRAQRDAETADIFSFVLWQTGTPGFQAR